MRSFTFKALGPFSLTAAIAFLERFPPAFFDRTPAGDLELAFVSDRTWQPVGVEQSQRRSAVNGRLWGDAPVEAVRRQVQRILSLDVDARSFPDLGGRDPVVAGLQSRYPGLRPVCHWSPYEAAVWAVIAQRVREKQAAAVRLRLIQEFGHELNVNDKPMKAFPSPQRLLEMDSYPGLGGRKPGYLRAVAEAALAGDLDGDRLLDMPREEALAKLRTIPGIGQFSAELILIRGCGDPDFIAGPDQRLMEVIGEAYQLADPPTPAEFDRIADGWRPYRSWVDFLMRLRADAWDVPA